MEGCIIHLLAQMKKKIIFLILILYLPILNLSSDTLSKEQLKEELLYWKDLLDEDLISIEDYENQKIELINKMSNKNDNKINEDKASKTNESDNNIDNKTGFKVEGLSALQK